MLNSHLKTSRRTGFFPLSLSFRKFLFLRQTDFRFNIIESRLDFHTQTPGFSLAFKLSQWVEGEKKLPNFEHFSLFYIISISDSIKIQYIFLYWVCVCARVRTLWIIVIVGGGFGGGGGGDSDTRNKQMVFFSVVAFQWNGWPSLNLLMHVCTCLTSAPWP